jgi:Asp/Glu/hydantoin racemase
VLKDTPAKNVGEAAFHMASLIAAKFNVVTTLSRSIALTKPSRSRVLLSQGFFAGTRFLRVMLIEIRSVFAF